MQNTIQWFDRLLGRISDSREAARTALPGFVETIDEDIERDLERAEVLVVTRDVAKRLLVNGSAPNDLQTGFVLPFETVFFLFDEPVEVSGEKGHGIRGILVSQKNNRTYVRAWFEERHPTVSPRHDFSFVSGEELPEYYMRIADLIYWLSGYISSANVLAIRHNRRHDLLKHRKESGRPMAGSYYTFAVAQEPRKRRTQGPPSAYKIRTSAVHGHFRRAHWHTLPSGRGVAWYPTTWVRGHKRRIPAQAPSEEIKVAA